MGRQQAAKLRDKSNIVALQASVAAGPKVIVVEKVVEVVKIIEALTLTNSNQVEVIDIDIVDKIDEHPKFKKSRLSLEDENKLYSKCEQMNHDYKVLADKLERLDAENHNLRMANKELNEKMEMMKDVMAEKIKALMEENRTNMAEKIKGLMEANRTNMRENVKEAVMTAANTVKEKMDEDYAVILAEKDTKFMQTIKEMEAKADADRTKMLSLQNKVKDLEKYDSRTSGSVYVRMIKLGKEMAEQENLRARIIATNSKCPKCAERIAAFEMTIAACQQKLVTEMRQHEKEYDNLLEENGGLKYFLEINEEKYNALKQKYES